MPCTPMETTLAVSALDTTAIAEMGTPFDADERDRIGPADWNTNYGKPPELVAMPYGTGFDVLWQDTTESPPRGFVVHVEPEGEGYAVQSAYELDLIDVIMGLTRDEQGNYYYATGIDEDDDITVEDPPEGVHRGDIVRLVKFTTAGCVLMESDVDIERGLADDESEAIINPMVAGSSRLAYGDGTVALLHSINTPPDSADVRHQKALTTHLDAMTGAVTRTDSMWVSHSFDQRLLWDGAGFVELHLGDAYPRRVALGRFTPDSRTDTYGLYAPKGGEGDNATYTRLGGIAPVASGDYGFLVVFATDRSAEIATQQWQALVGHRDVALVRVARGFADMSSSGSDFVDQSGDVQTVESSGEMVDNYVTWLTDHTAEGGVEAHAGRPRIAALTGDRFVVLWERWEGEGEDEDFVGTYAVEIDSAGAVVTPAALVSDRHIPRGDDAFTLGGKAALVLGDEATTSLTLLLVGPGLETSTFVLE